MCSRDKKEYKYHQTHISFALKYASHTAIIAFGFHTPILKYPPPYTHTSPISFSITSLSLLSYGRLAADCPCFGTANHSFSSDIRHHDLVIHH